METSATFKRMCVLGLLRVDGIVFDLGVSSVQLNDARRGFSFAADGPLDMRMDRSTGRTAAELVAQLSESELSNLIFQNGEERFARRIARALVQVRIDRPLQTTNDLVSAIGAQFRRPTDMAAFTVRPALFKHYGLPSIASLRS